MVAKIRQEECDISLETSTVIYICYYFAIGIFHFIDPHMTFFLDTPEQNEKKVETSETFKAEIHILGTFIIDSMQTVLRYVSITTFAIMPVKIPIEHCWFSNDIS